MQTCWMTLLITVKHYNRNKRHMKIASALVNTHRDTGKLSNAKRCRRNISEQFSSKGWPTKTKQMACKDYRKKKNWGQTIGVGFYSSKSPWTGENSTLLKFKKCLKYSWFVWKHTYLKTQAQGTAYICKYIYIYINKCGYVWNQGIGRIWVWVYFKAGKNFSNVLLLVKN